MFLILANILSDFSLSLPNEDSGILGTQYKVSFHINIFSTGLLS
jgi:hypothetical protein